MLPRVLEPEVMDTAEEAVDYDTMDHGAVNRVFVTDFLAVWGQTNPILDVATGTAKIQSSCAGGTPLPRWWRWTPPSKCCSWRSRM